MLSPARVALAAASLLTVAVATCTLGGADDQCLPHEVAYQPEPVPLPVASDVFEPNDEGEVAIRDRDHDGVPETLTRTYEGGSGFGGFACHLEDRSIELDVWATTYGSFGSFGDVAVEPAGLEHPAFATALRECLFKGGDVEDASFERWMQLMRASHAAWSGADRWDAPLEFHHGAPRLPRSVTRVIEPSAVEPWMQRLHVGDGLEGFGERPLWLHYGAQNHFLGVAQPEFRELARRGQEQLLATNHGVVWVIGNTHAWVFVSDEAFGGPEKLRHRSIADAGFAGEKSVWVRLEGQSNVFLVDAEGVQPHETVSE